MAGWALWLVIAPLVVNALTGPWLVASGEDGDERIVGVLLTAFSVMGALAAWAHGRTPTPLVWAALWAVPLAFAGTAAVMVAEGASGLAGYYGAIALLSGVGVALVR